MTTLIIGALAVLLAVALMPVWLPWIAREISTYRRGRDYSPYQREIPITRTTGDTVDLVGVKPTRKSA